MRKNVLAEMPIRFSIREEDSYQRHLCDEKGKIVASYDPRSFFVPEIIEEAGKNSARENPEIA